MKNLDAEAVVELIDTFPHQSFPRQASTAVAIPVVSAEEPTNEPGGATIGQSKAKLPRQGPMERALMVFGIGDGGGRPARSTWNGWPQLQNLACARCHRGTSRWLLRGAGPRHDSGCASRTGELSGTARGHADHHGRRQRANPRVDGVCASWSGWPHRPNVRGIPYPSGRLDALEKKPLSVSAIVANLIEASTNRAAPRTPGVAEPR